MSAVSSLKLSQPNEGMAEFCRPLLDESDITFFAHLRKHEDGGVSLLSNHQEWYLHCFQREYCILSESIADLHKLAPNYSIWSAERTDRPLQVIYNELRVVFSIKHGITLSREEEKHYDFYLFASDKGNSELINYYINNTNRLEAFISDYLQNAHNLITEADELKFYNRDEGISAKQYSENKEKIDRMRRKAEKPILSKREMECALHCKEGRSAKETAEILNLSRRTVEYYLEKVKIKLDCSSKYELITKLYDKNIIPRN